tara:strand:- start:66 stop:449 length:384 start_codon:yes stop_codon:yes gene_type:complete
MNTPQDLFYTKEHEWVRIADGKATVGITDFAQGELGDVVFVELPEVGSDLQQMKELGTIESVKTASDFYAPLSGRVVEINGDLENQPELVNSDPYGGGWLVVLEVGDLDAEKSNLLSAADYQALVSD